MVVELVWGMILTIATAMLAIGEIYEQWRTKRVYAGNREVALLIGRYTEGIDHKGRRTGRIIK